MKAAFAASFAVRLIEPVRKRLAIPCAIVSGDEAGILDRLGHVGEGHACAKPGPAVAFAD